MNYLAHLLLAGDHPHNIGGLLGDFAKGDVWQQYRLCCTNSDDLRDSVK